jgi:two-component system chemotaxis sensor kinase CheA
MRKTWGLRRFPSGLTTGTPVPKSTWASSPAAHSIRYAIPQSSICELVRVKRKEAATRIQCMKGTEVLRLRGTLLPLVRLNSVLGQATTDGAKSPAAAQNIVAAEAGHMRFGLVVDGLHDSEEIVVKPLGRHMRKCGCLAGATILGDGQGL